MELGAALVGLARQILRLRLSVQRVRNNRKEAASRGMTIRFIHASGSSSELIIDKS
jgi:hypothetical protein